MNYYNYNIYIFKIITIVLLRYADLGVTMHWTHGLDVKTKKKYTEVWLGSLFED
jgi:hypothetical protein